MYTHIFENPSLCQKWLREEVQREKRVQLKHRMPLLWPKVEKIKVFASFFMFPEILKLSCYVFAILLQFEGAWANRHKHDKNGVKNVNATFVLF